MSKDLLLHLVSTENGEVVAGREAAGPYCRGALSLFSCFRVAPGECRAYWSARRGSLKQRL